MTAALQQAVLKWWTSKRPAHWTVEQHLVQPCVNCRGQIEFDLAIACAKMVSEGKNK